MRLAAELGVPVPGVDLLRLPEPLYVIERFDRQAAKKDGGDAGASVQRLHRIDLCQALGVSPSKKYESEGGLGLHLHLCGGGHQRSAVLVEGSSGKSRTGSGSHRASGSDEIAACAARQALKPPFSGRTEV